MISLRIGRTLGGFHCRVAYRLTGRQPRRGLDGTWVYPPLAEKMSEAGIQEGDTYVACCQNTVVQYIKTMTIMDLCMAAERRLGTRVSKRWWDQEGLELEVIWTAAWEAEREEIEGEADGAEKDMEY